MQTEIWRPVEGYEGLYEVSSLGRVKSLKYGREKVLKPWKDGWGYLLVTLCRNGKVKHFKAHRLVATAFLPNPMRLPEINHKDEDKTNNCVSNLEFCDRRYNLNYGTHNERMAASKSKPVEASKYPDFSEICLTFASTNEAGRNGYNKGHVSSCCNGCYHYKGNNKYKNLYWRFSGRI